MTHGLVMRYFGSKEGLLHASIQEPDELDTVLLGGTEGPPERIATAFVERMEVSSSSDRLVALIRGAAAVDPLAIHLYLTMHARSARADRAAITGRDFDARVDHLGSALLGVNFSRYVVRAGTLAMMEPAELSRCPAELVRPFVRPPGRAPTESGV
ncbi:hypothetical protein [Streptomyces parvulus]|uniref:TetR/AcrR family transcriptional regulator n=1 Tax=Streptomyces parvulus TaxID=146923 RepID=UPI0036FF5ED0